MNTTRLGNRGLPLGVLSHLLCGTEILIGVGYYHDANLCGVVEGKANPPDDEVKRINSMEENLLPLSNDLVELRTQIDLCCVWRYDFPQNLEEVLNAIGRGEATFIRMHSQIDPERRNEIMSFGRALRGWLDGKDAKELSGEWDERVVSWIYDILGELSELKELLVEKACLTLGDRCLDCSFWGLITGDSEINLQPDHSESIPEDWRNRVKCLNKRAQQVLPDAKNWRDLNGGPNPPCHFKFMHRLRTGILSIGRGRWLGGKVPGSESFSDRKAKVAEIAEMLGCWVKGVPFDIAMGERRGPSDIARNVYELLGEQNPEKEWLVESLRYNIEHQRGREGYDSFSMQRWIEYGDIKNSLLEQLVKR